MRVHAPPPASLALICGDAIHNLRTALDYLVRQLGIADAGKVRDRSEFPIVRDESYWASVAGRTLALLRADHIEAIHRLQPFVDTSDNSPNIMLSALDVLENLDKHRLALAVVAAAVKGDVTFHPGARRVEVSAAQRGPIALDGKSCCFAWRRPRSQASGLISRLSYRSLSPSGSMGGPTVRNLRDTADLVAGIVGSFAIDLSSAQA